MATEREASPTSQEPVPDNGQQPVLSPPAIVDPGGAGPSPAPPTPQGPNPSPSPVTITTTPPPPTTDPSLHEETIVATQQIETTPTTAPSDSDIPVTTQALLASIIQANPNYTYNVIQPSPDAPSVPLSHSEVNPRPPTVISSGQVSNTPSVIVLANTAQYSHNHNQGKHYLIQTNANQHSIEHEPPPSQALTEEEVVFNEQQTYIPEAQNISICASNSSAPVSPAVSTQVGLESTTLSTAVVINEPVTTSGVVLASGQIIYDSAAVENNQVNPQQVQIDLRSSYATNNPVSVSTIPALLSRHSIITTSTQAIPGPLPSYTGINNITSVISSPPSSVHQHQEQEFIEEPPAQPILLPHQQHQLPEELQQQLLQEAEQKEREKLLQEDKEQQLKEELVQQHLQLQTRQHLRQHLQKQQAQQQLKEHLQQEQTQQQLKDHLQQQQTQQQLKEHLLQQQSEQQLREQLQQQQTEQQLREQLLQQQTQQQHQDLQQPQTQQQPKEHLLQQLPQQQLTEQQQQAQLLQEQIQQLQLQKLQQQQQEQQQQTTTAQSQPVPIVSLSNFVLANSVPRRELIMRPASGTPPLSASDVLISSFNVLEDGDPVHRYQVNTTGNPQPQHYEEQSSTQAYSQWSSSDLDHNRSAILKALQEQPQAGSSREVGRQNEQVAVSPLDNSIGTRVSQNPQWKNIKEEPNYTQMELAKPHTVTYASMQNRTLPPVSPSYPNTAADGPTTALKSAFAGAHFLCKFCPERFRIPEKLTEHIKRVHSGSVVYTCFTCGKKFYNSHDLREHVPTHANEPIKCSLCNLTLESTKELRAHHKKAHPLATMSCPLCDKVFASSSARAKHLRSEHNGDKTLIICEQCGDPFVERGSYEEHIRTHRKTLQALQSGQLTVTSQRKTSPASTVVIWKCDKCGLVFPNDVELNKHTSSVHTPQVVNPKMVMTTLPDSSFQPGGKFPSDPASVPATKYELLRLLLRRRKAAESGTGFDASAATTPVSDIQGQYNLQADASVAGQQDLNSRPPVELLSAEAMQHVAEELSMLQGMNQGKNAMGSALATPITADNIIDADSTMGINLTMNKNASPASKVKEMQKHKTLVNMLQGTVASIIEREVKHPRPTRSVSWTEPGDKQSVTSGQNVISYSAPVTKASALGAYTTYSQENPVSGLSSNAAGLLPSVVQTSNSSNSRELVMDNQQMIAHSAIASPFTTTAQGSFTSNTMPAQNSIQESAFQQELRSFLDMSQNINTPSDVTQVTSAQVTPNQAQPSKTSWDCHIEPLIKLFQNVNPQAQKIPGGENLPNPDRKAQEDLQCSIHEQGAPGTREDNAILDLSSNRSNYYGIDGAQPAQMTPDMNVEQVAAGRLPHFNEVSWAPGREKNTDSGLYEKTTEGESGFYENYSTYTNPHSDLNQMSGGHLTYVQSGQSQEAVPGFYEHNIESAQYIPSREQNLNSYIQYDADREKSPPGEPPHLQSSGRELQVLQDQHLNILNQQQLQQHHDQQDERLLLQQQQEMQQFQQHQPVSQGEGQGQHSQFIESPNDTFSQMLQENTVLHIQNGNQMESLHPHNPNQHYIKMTDAQNGNVLQTDGVQQIISPDQHYLEPNNNNNNGNKLDSEYQRLYEKIPKNTKPQYEGLRNMILSRRFNPDVPLVVRHKLLATMLKENAIEGQTSPPKEPDSTTEGHPNGLVATGSNVQPIDVPVTHHQMPDAYQLNVQTLNEGNFIRPEELLHPGVKDMKRLTDQTTVDQQLLSQMISEMPPPQDMQSVECVPHMNKQGATPPPLLPHSKIAYQIRGYDLGIPAPEATGNHTRHLADMRRSSEGLVLSGFNEDIQQRLSYEKGLGARLNTQKRKRAKPCPAIHKRRCTIIIQKAEDVFILNDDAVNSQAEKRKRTCEELRCRVPKVVKPTPPKSRGRPPKNGQVPMKKGSYKKGQYPCPVCKKVYAWKNYLRIHIAKHDKEVKKTQGSPGALVPEDDMPPLLPPMTNVV